MENRLQERRLELGMTQGQVSARMKEKEPRVDVGMISRYEKGVCLPTRAQIEVLEEIYNQSRTELYKIEDIDLVGYLPISGDKPPPRKASVGSEWSRPATWDGFESVTASANSLPPPCRMICWMCAATPPGRAGTMPA